MALTKSVGIKQSESAHFKDVVPVRELSLFWVDARDDLCNLCSYETILACQT